MCFFMSEIIVVRRERSFWLGVWLGVEGLDVGGFGGWGWRWVEVFWRIFVNCHRYRSIYFF